MNSAPTEVEEAVGRLERDAKISAIYRKAGQKRHKVAVGEEDLRLILSDYARLQSESAKEGEAIQAEPWRENGWADVEPAFRLECIRRSLENWLQYDAESRRREGLSVSPGDHIIPPTWPSRGCLSIWIKAIAEAEAALSPDGGGTEP